MLLRGLALRARGQLERAVVDLTAATGLDEDFVAAYEARAEILPYSFWISSPPPEGSTGPNLNQFTWFQFALASNYISSPRLLACPADPTVRIASDWGGSIGGFIYVANPGNALSYTLSPHARVYEGKTILCTDRNIRFSGMGQCGYTGVNTMFPFCSTDSANTGWTNDVHGLQGHVLTTDGAVALTTSAEFKAALPGSAPLPVHFGSPR